MDPVARLQYALMLVLGTVCLLAAVAPLGYETKVALVSVTFGVTVGLWISHLIRVVVPEGSDRAVPE